MYAYRYINRHYFLEHEGRLYVVDTGCPKSFSINGTVPWVDKTPAAVILDMHGGAIRFHRNDPYDIDNPERLFSFQDNCIPFVRAPKTRAPIIHAESPYQNVIWDTGAQIGYAVGLSELIARQRIKVIEEKGPFVDFSPIYGVIRSEKTWEISYKIRAPGGRWPLTIVALMADAPPRIAGDLLSEGANAVLGNGWMHQDTCTIAIKGRMSQIIISGRSSLHQEELCSRFGWIDGPFRGHLPDPEPENVTKIDPMPLGADSTGLMPILRPAPTQLGAFTVEALRHHLEMDNIDGLIGNDLLMDTLL